LAIRGQSDVEVFNVVSLHGGLVGSFPDSPYDTQLGYCCHAAALARNGLPSYAQFDNDNRFQGPINIRTRSAESSVLFVAWRGAGLCATT